MAANDEAWCLLRSRPLPEHPQYASAREGARRLARRPGKLAPHLEFGSLNGRDLRAEDLIGRHFHEEEEATGRMVEFVVVAVGRKLIESRYVPTAWFVPAEREGSLDMDAPSWKKSCHDADLAEVMLFCMGVEPSSELEATIGLRLQSLDCHPLMMRSARAAFKTDPFVASNKDNAPSWYKDLKRRLRDVEADESSSDITWLLTEQMSLMQDMGDGILRRLGFVKDKRKRDDGDYSPYITTLDEMSLSDNMLVLFEALLAFAGFTKEESDETTTVTWVPIDHDAVRRLFGTPASLTGVNFLLKVKYFSLKALESFNRGKKTPVDTSVINPMDANDTKITLASVGKSWALDDAGAQKPAWALRHEMINEMIGVDVDDDAALSAYRPPDPRVAAYSTVYLEGEHLRSFRFIIKPKYIKGQPGAGEDSKLKMGAFVKLSFAWQAFTRDQPNQELLPLHRSI